MASTRPVRSQMRGAVEFDDVWRVLLKSVVFGVACSLVRSTRAIIPADCRRRGSPDDADCRDFIGQHPPLDYMLTAVML